MEFPKDHYTHDTPIEWIYFWGKFDSGQFFHLASFRAKLAGLHTRTTQWSIHNGDVKYFEEVSDDFNQLRNIITYVAKGNWFALTSNHFFLRAYPQTQPIIHKVLSHRNYYSIPDLNGEGFFSEKEIKADIWMDHEFSAGKDFSNWDWLGIKLDCGMRIMCFDSKTDKCCSISFKEKNIESEFNLEARSLSIDSLGMYLTLEPLEQEKIFDPKFGVDYSEVPFDVISNGKVIGYGMRERTYHKEKGDG